MLAVAAVEQARMTLCKRGGDLRRLGCRSESVELTAITAGEFHTCSIKTDGKPVCWGWDKREQASPPQGVKLATPDESP